MIAIVSHFVSITEDLLREMVKSSALLGLSLARAAIESARITNAK